MLKWPFKTLDNHAAPSCVISCTDPMILKTVSVRAVHDVPHLGKERILFQKERGLSPREGVFKTKSVLARGCPPF